MNNLALALLPQLLLLLLHCYALQGNAQDQTGFISIDCGLQGNISSYNEKTTGITYVSDESFVESGERSLVAEKYREKNQQQFLSLRSFPQGNRNCYKIDVVRGSNYLIRASFLFGDHDGQEQVVPPAFDLYLGPNLWDNIKIKDSSTQENKEIVHVAPRDYLHVCVVNTGQGVPFVSAIKLRPLDDSGYRTPLGSLTLFIRRDVGSSRGYGTGKDTHDRFWYSHQFALWKNISTSQIVESQDPSDRYNVPSIVMSTAATHKDPNASMDLWWDASDNATRFYFFIHFAEIEQLGANNSREFNIFYNGAFFHGPVSPSYLATTTVSTPTPITGPIHNFSLSMTENSTLPPIINAFETYIVQELPQMESDQQDIDAITKLKLSNGLRRNWQGDPFAPKEYSWEGLTCSYDGPPRITSLNLSGSGLTGEIAPSLANLSMIEDLNLSGNNFTGPVPEFLSRLPTLKTLNLENNQLTGPVPHELLDKWNKGVLSLRVNGNPELCTSASCHKKRSSILVVVISVTGSIVLLLLVAIAIAWLVLRRKKQYGEPKEKYTFDEYSLGSRKRRFAYSDIRTITNNFEKVLGKGGFGIVYRGRIGDTQVAVKELSSGVQGYQQFQAEVDILLRVYHRNLTTLVGYYNDENHTGLVYELMANGDLQSHLLDDKSATTNLKWEERLRIAVDAAQGLEYLHQGCKPPIIHRDVKSANILLNENFQAKISDFGISKTFPADSKATYVSTVVAGTPGYLDPEYYMSNRLNEKTDVYSFGILLMEIITGKLAASKSQGNSSVFLSEWVSLTLEKGLINVVIDPRLHGNFNLNSAWKVAEIAMNCVSSISTDRPTMSQVVGELKVSLEMAQVPEGKELEFRDPSDIIPLNFIDDHMSFQPLAR